MGQTWNFIDDNGTFELDAPHRNSYLYFPLVNEAGMMSSITPLLHGDIKTGQNHFLLAPVSVDDLHNTRSGRNFWVTIEGLGAWSAAGQSAPQIAGQFEADEQVKLQAGFLWHCITRQSDNAGLRAEITSFVPLKGDRVELMKVTLTNVSDRPLSLTPTAAIPLYGRSADNLRDHRHVTSLLNRIRTTAHGVSLCPILSFDERGHLPNVVSYSVLGLEQDGTPPVGFFPILEDFIGEGGCLEWPEAVVQNIAPQAAAGQEFEGRESIGGLRFRMATLAPGSSRSYVLVLSITDGETDPEVLLQTYGDAGQFDRWLKHNQDDWQKKLSSLVFQTGEPSFGRWARWVTIQPILRRLFGNSFLPYHDYGRGGRGWRDLWQDCLTLLLMEPDGVDNLLFSYYAGVRIDGSNATIIGDRPGEFRADRNNIARVWMDHGAWPWLTTRLYIDASGDLSFLLREQAYFKDHHIYRARKVDSDWTPAQGTRLMTAKGEPYNGSILEHLLVQHLTAFFNVGEHNNILLEGADWNDAFDMGHERGESVAFSALYAGNLRALGEFCQLLVDDGVRETMLTAELMPLLDSLQTPLDYELAPDKRQRLQDYFDAVRHTVSGKKTTVKLADVARDLLRKSGWLTEHIRQNEWITNGDGHSWFNGYYDNDGIRVEGDHADGVRMTLTGQVFTLMCGVASDEQVAHIVRAADRYLYDETVEGYRLNTHFGGMLFSMGRAFGFAYGHKENGAMFSHMATMYANALYRRGMVKEGWKVLRGIYNQCQDFARSRMYPGIPEYFNERGRGAYTYLTGSASWYLLTLLTEAFGVRGNLGDLVLEPKLVAEQFDASGRASVQTLFAGKRLKIAFENPGRLEYGSYAIERVSVNGKAISLVAQSGQVVIDRETIAALPDQVEIIVSISAL